MTGAPVTKHGLSFLSLEQGRADILGSKLAVNESHSEWIFLLFAFVFLYYWHFVNIGCMYTMFTRYLRGRCRTLVHDQFL